MKKQFYATCVPGLERAVEAQLKQEPGVVLEWASDGVAMFRAERTPNFSYLHNVFLVLQSMSGLQDLDAAVKKLLATGDWLDRMPFEQAQGKRFRIVTMHQERLVPVDMRYLHLLEQTISEHTGMRPHRERPDVELWLIRRGGRVTVFCWRLTSQHTAKGQGVGLRPDLCATMAWLAKAGGGSALCIGADEGSRLAHALRQAGSKSLKVLPDLEAGTTVSDASMDAIAGILFLSPKSSFGGAEARDALMEVRRLLSPEGRAALLAPEGALSAALEQTPGLEPMDHFTLSIGGRRLHLWVVTPLQATPGD